MSKTIVILASKTHRPLKHNRQPEIDTQEKRNWPNNFQRRLKKNDLMKVLSANETKVFQYQ